MKIARLKLHSWVGSVAVDAQHYYGDIEYWDREETRLRAVPDADRLRRINRDRRERYDLYRGEKLQPGEPSDQFYSRNELLFAACEFFRHEENRRGCDVLVADGDGRNPGEVVWCADELLWQTLQNIHERFEWARSFDMEEEEDRCYDEWAALLQEDERPARWAKEEEEEDDYCCDPVTPCPAHMPPQQEKAAKEEDARDLPHRMVLRSGPARRTLRPSEFPETCSKLAAPVHVVQIEGQSLANSYTESFYMVSCDVTDHDDKRVGVIQYGEDTRIAVQRGGTRLLITGPELWEAMQPLLDEVEATPEKYLECTKQYR